MGNDTAKTSTKPKVKTVTPEKKSDTSPRSFKKRRKKKPVKTKRQKRLEHEALMNGMIRRGDILESALFSRNYEGTDDYTVGYKCAINHIAKFIKLLPAKQPPKFLRCKHCEHFTRQSGSPTGHCSLLDLYEPPEWYCAYAVERGSTYDALTESQGKKK